jgi:hypothetical protein
MNTLAYPRTLAPQSRGQAGAQTPGTVKSIPFDYVFQFDLTGTPRNKLQDVVEISIEGAFVALSLGYSLAPGGRAAPISFPPALGVIAQVPTVAPFFPAPSPTPIVRAVSTEAPTGVYVAGTPGDEVALLNLSAVMPEMTRFDPLTESTAKIGPDGTVKIKFPPLGGTPEFPQPPRKLLRVWDRTNNLQSQLFEAGPPSTPSIGPDPRTFNLPAAGDRKVSVYGSVGAGVAVFLLQRDAPQGPLKYATPEDSTLTLEPLPLETDADGVVIHTGEVDVPLPPLSPDDVLLVRYKNPDAGFDQPTIPFSTFTVPRPKTSATVTLGEVEAELEKRGADLARGFRLNPRFANLAGLPLNQLSATSRDSAFEVCGSAAEEVSFLYSIDVGSTGREYQNKPIHNVAGLGIANGDRPFRPFAKPMMFEPRSFVRIQVEEISGPPGRLFIVLQGYKLLGTGRIPG